MIFISVILVLLLFGVVILLALPALAGQPWVPANEQRIHGALKLAALKPGEMLYDLGSGDGRVLIAAARDFGAKGVGVELSPLLCLAAWIKVRAAGASEQVGIECGSYLTCNLSSADVVYLYLTQANANGLFARLKTELKPGGRVVSVSTEIEGWQPSEMDRDNLLFLYRVPSS
jgi:cyclopropane fatty-acyl-phospholipid synthase-like methyltransferase